ncbi:hypothetical protein ACPZ19_35195 [Amycolatopsis lurida]|nr:hypothetical protein [Amycolatopsis sp. YIM 10]QFU87802.1 hypothetical protein YIM_13080 [Amycolatopsis sp. YIM 10]
MNLAQEMPAWGGTALAIASAAALVAVIVVGLRALRNNRRR